MKVIKFLSYIRTNAFFKNNAIFWVGSLTGSFVNYLYYPILGRIMHPADFGEVQTIVSIFTQISVFFQVLGLIGIGIITKYADEELRTKINSEISRMAFYISIALLLVIALFSAKLKNFFHFDSVLPFLALACSLLISVPMAFSNSYLQGHKRFWALATSNLIIAAGRIMFAVVFILAGFRALGAIGGLLCAQLIALVYSLKKGKGIGHFVANHLRLQKIRVGVIRGELSFITAVFLTSLTTNLLLNLDILAIKHYFPPRAAGFYTGISIIANIVYFVTGPIAGVLVSSISASQTEVESFSYLRRSLYFLLPIGGSITLFFILFPHLVVTLLLGNSFGAYASYLQGLSIALFLLSVANLFIYYHIGRRHNLIASVVAIGLVTTIVLLWTRHGTMGAVVGDLEMGAFTTLALIVGLSAMYSRISPLKGQSLGFA